MKSSHMMMMNLCVLLVVFSSSFSYVIRQQKIGVRYVYKKNQYKLLSMLFFYYYYIVSYVHPHTKKKENLYGERWRLFDYIYDDRILPWNEMSGENSVSSIHSFNHIRKKHTWYNHFYNIDTTIIWVGDDDISFGR